MSRSWWEWLSELPTILSGAKEYPHLVGFFAVVKKRNSSKREIAQYLVPSLIFVVSGALAFLFGMRLALQMFAVYLFTGFGIGAIAAVMAYFGIRSTLTEEEKNQIELRKKATALEEKLNGWKNRLGIEKAVSKPTLGMLNEGAKSWLEVYEVFHSPVWMSQEPIESWKIARDKALVAMDLSMLNLISMSESADARMSDPSTVAHAESVQILSGMRQMAEEAVRLTQKMKKRLQVDEPTSENQLRKALENMKRLENAEDELDQFQF